MLGITISPRKTGAHRFYGCGRMLCCCGCNLELGLGTLKSLSFVSCPSQIFPEGCERNILFLSV